VAKSGEAPLTFDTLLYDHQRLFSGCPLKFEPLFIAVLFLDSNEGNKMG